MANWEGVSEFVAVAESSSFTLAARKLSTSVAQVSRRVAALEDRLAVKLLNRTTRKVTLTEAGMLYFQQCKHLVDGLEQAELAVTQMQTTPKGLVRVTAPVTYGELHLAPLINQFLEQYPQVDVELVLTNQKLDLIESGVDLAIRLGRLEDSTLLARRLSTRQSYVCASRDYLDRHGEPHTLSELSKHQCLVGSVDVWRFKDKQQSRALRISGRLKCNSGFALRDAAKRGLGLIQLPDYYIQQDLESGELIEVLAQYRDDKEGIWALFPSSVRLSPKVRLLVDFLVKGLSKGSSPDSLSQH
ncbi:LysR family transcriptional regulator [Photobacterium sp. WH77]|uniref:LysR family transcriptional regulator n=1 Tax=unclassified Photobacterium TaxID=2628852 RepID=UPI001C467D72|nr:MULTISPECIES: LysR family transcriptional regulator [unclassified Photobacterium]MBV7263841.1 LysR family transcriptional regulator [Photobacterium sp. WH24]MCG2837537.1 LysR family transcriptional regulator [Photobacterium sp. WH77]MCG2845153.1 LysR family transcriptional regulator [Photobacterium sp. WH80]